MREKVLILSDKKINIKRDKNYFHYLPLYENLQKPNIDNFTKKIPNRREILRRYSFCNNRYKKMIIFLTKKLNEIHKVKYKKVFWEIYLGPWLQEYIRLCYKCYLNLIDIRKQRIKKIIAPNYKVFNFTSLNTYNFSCLQSNKEWYLNFNSKFVDYFKNESLKIKFLNQEKKLIKSKKQITNKRFIFSLINKFGYIFKKNDDAFISHTYLPFFQEKKLEFLFNQIPTFYIEKEILKNFYNKNLRNKFFRKKIKQISFDSFLINNLKEFLPLSLIENFDEIKKVSKSDTFPQKPKFIFTSVLNQNDESFKHYLGQKFSEGVKFYIGQHGNNYFSNIHLNDSICFKNNSNFLSWGVKKKKKITPLFNFKVLNKSISYNTGGNFLIVLNTLENVVNNLFYDPQIVYEDNVRIIKFIQDLNPDIKKNVLIRLHKSYYENFLGNRYIDLLNNLGVKIDKGDIKIEKLIKNSRVCLFNYDSTGFLENSLNNVPSMMFLNKFYLNSINQKFLNKYKILQQNNILFDDPMKLQKHLKKIWNNVDQWWLSVKTVNCLKKFNKNFNLKPYKNSLFELKNSLKY